MNYTTANQYIRVAKEFSSMMLQRKDFGFEHFKALLPLPTSARTQIIENLPEDNVSVKSLRNLVMKTLFLDSKDQERNNKPKINTNAITENLHKVKTQLNALNLEELSHGERWKLLGVFRSISEEMIQFADLIAKKLAMPAAEVSRPLDGAMLR